MAQIQFYHLTTSPLERALPKLLEKAQGAGFRVLVKLADDQMVELFDKILWTYHPAAFLPHGTARGPQPEDQPVLLASAFTNLNHAKLLCITDGSLAADPENYERILDMFDGTNPDSLAAARGRWKHYKDAGHAVTYFSQTDKGGWEQKAA